MTLLANSYPSSPLSSSKSAKGSESDGGCPRNYILNISAKKQLPLCFVMASR